MAMTKKELAVKYFAGGYNCAQSVVLAFCDELGIPEEQAAIMSEGFGGGMGRTRSVCGAVSGMVMLASLRYSKGKAGDMDTRLIIYGKIKDMFAEFEEEFGTKICSELMKQRDSSAGPGGHQKNCVECVEKATELAEKHLFS